MAGNCYKIQVGGFSLFGGGQGTGTITIQKPTGACCLPDGSCLDGLTEADCLETEGSVWFEGEVCERHVFEIEDCENVFEDISDRGILVEPGQNDGIPIGFTFSFFKEDHDEIGISANGYLTFGGDLDEESNDEIPSRLEPNNAIYVFWSPLNLGDAGTIHYQTLGNKPARQFIAQWTDVLHFGFPGCYLHWGYCMSVRRLPSCCPRSTPT